MKAKEEFKKYTSNLDDYVVLLNVSPKSYQKTNIDILKALISEQKVPGIYIALNKPYRILQRLMSQNGIDDKLVIFIDAVTCTDNQESKKIHGCLFMGSPEKLSDMSIAIDQAVKSLTTDKKFVFFDSLSTLATFNSSQTVARFVYFLAAKMREWRVMGIIVTIDGDMDNKIISELTQICDARIDVGCNNSNNNFQKKIVQVGGVA